MADDSQNGIEHHPEYYLRDGNIIFLVENTLFCVHRLFFERESQFFIEKFAHAPQDGISDDNAFLVEGVTSADFAKLLWVWYSPKYRLDNKTSEHWLVILELSTRWKFLRMKELAVDQLQNLEMDPVEKIAIYNKYELDNSLLLREYKHLCTREGRMSIEEGEKVGLPTILGIHQARERALMSAVAQGCRSPTSADVDDEELEKILKHVFNLNISSSARSRRGAGDQVPSGNTDRQGAQSQGQPNSAFTNNIPRPDASSVSRDLPPNRRCHLTD
ncbi:uncharacterized protein EDB91DRAFT_1061124 [Suillus paluster]|uniref:uncharacterized protein n=1 Tax=Suillus paluster TaxID=48578 RepID=UPI001B872C50|nr:uncharacterized protein EDB91DRAFT_1061124 [Suillus paluster]KAG1727468.1 hypothetical protein EDB91DRAFT_1061124 [Suillus paluster]